MSAPKAFLPKLKRYRASSGAEIIAGNDDRSNEYLTFKAAKRTALWFHVKGFPGSHVALETEGKPTSDDVREAAEVAAYFSKMRGGKNVPVSYCPIVNVRKPERAKPGTVTITGQKTILVTPALPDAPC